MLENIGDLVVKEANEAGGYGMLIGPKSTKEEQENFKSTFWLIQEIILPNQRFHYLGCHA